MIKKINFLGKKSTPKQTLICLQQTILSLTQTRTWRKSPIKFLEKCNCSHQSPKLTNYTPKFKQSPHPTHHQSPSLLPIPIHSKGTLKISHSLSSVFKGCFVQTIQKTPSQSQAGHFLSIFSF